MGWFLSVASSSIPIQIEIYEEKDIYHQYVIKNCRLFQSGKIDFEIMQCGELKQSLQSEEQVA